MFLRIDRLAKDTYGMTRQEAHEKGICIRCQQEVLVLAADGSPKWNEKIFYSPAGKKEWDISAMCEKCFDSLFDEEEQ